MKSSVLAVALAAVMLAACGKKEEPKVETPAAAPAPAAVDVAKPAEEAKK
jgi:putrescine transport system substrate-binding protein